MTSSKICRSQFNPELILLKSSRKGVALPYSYWGGTDNEELGIAPETGFGPPVLRNHQSLSLPSALSCPYLPWFTSQTTFADDLPREAFSRQFYDGRRRPEELGIGEVDFCCSGSRCENPG